MLQSMGSQRVGNDLATEQQQPVKNVISSVQLLSRVQLFVTPWSAACQASLSILYHQQECHRDLLLVPKVEIFSTINAFHIVT